MRSPTSTVTFAIKLSAVSILTLGISACSDHAPVPISQCSEVVKRAQKVLGTYAPDPVTLMSQCKSATDSERGCVLASTKKGQIAQCM